MSTTVYKYRAIDAQGSQCRGTVDASSEQRALEDLAKQGLVPLSIRETSKSLIQLQSDKVTALEVATLTRELSVLIEANIPIARGLKSIAEHEKNQALRVMVSDIATMIEAGEKITVAFSKYNDVFGDVYISTLRSAEKTGQIGPVSAHLADMLERNIEMGQQIKRAMAYPVIVICFVAFALSVIVIFVVPKFAEIFEANGVELPLTTRAIRAMGDSIKMYWWLYLGLLVCAAYGLRAMWRNEGGRFKLEKLIHMIPYIGKIFTSVTTARFSRVMSIGLESGIEVIEAMEIAGNSTGRPVFQDECVRMCDRMRTGEALEDVINSAQGLPSFARRLFGSGKDSQELARAGKIIARHYDRQSDHLSKNINIIIEPMITIAMAGIVLLVALSVFLPMWEMVRITKS